MVTHMRVSFVQITYYKPKKCYTQDFQDAKRDRFCPAHLHMADRTAEKF